MCWIHYKQWGKDNPHLVRKTTVGCKVDGCEENHFGLGYCRRHHAQWKRYGHILSDEKEIRLCEVEGCNEKHFGLGFCQKHHMQWRRHGRIVEKKTGCKVEGCSNPHCSLGYCERHYMQWKKYGKIYGHPARTKFDSNPHRFEGDVCIMSLTDQEGNITKEFIIDKEDFDRVKEHKWGGGEKYIINKNVGYLHWFILGKEKPESREIQMDHINMDTFDNRKINLRICTRSQNSANVRKRRTNTSGYKGVFKALHGGWRVQIGFEGKRFYIGSYATKEQAAMAYNKVAVEYFGEFAQLNQIEGGSI